MIEMNLVLRVVYSNSPGFTEVFILESSRVPFILADIPLTVEVDLSAKISFNHYNTVDKAM